MQVSLNLYYFLLLLLLLYLLLLLLLLLFNLILIPPLKFVGARFNIVLKNIYIKIIHVILRRHGFDFYLCESCYGEHSQLPESLQHPSTVNVELIDNDDDDDDDDAISTIRNK